MLWKNVMSNGRQKVHPAAGGVSSPAVVFKKTVGHLRDASENPAAQATPPCAVARHLGEPRIFGGPHIKSK
jgi:hypothetical protein